MPSHIVVNGLGLTYKGTIGLSTATIPDVCKTPSPGGPVPIPYPNIANQSTLKSGSKTVKAKGNMIAIKGSQFGSSNGDEAGTAGGVKSSVNMKATDWITFSFDVKIDGKNACRHTDKKFHNNKNTVNLSGEIDPATGKPWHTCGEVDAYGRLSNGKKAAKPKFERDHIPAKATLNRRAMRKPGYKKLNASQRSCVKRAVEYHGIAIVIPKASHREHSPTCGSKNKAKMGPDSKSKQSMNDAIDRDTKAMQKHLNKTDKKCAAAYRKAVKKVKEFDWDKMINKAIKDCAKK